MVYSYLSHHYELILKQSLIGFVLDSIGNNDNKKSIIINIKHFQLILIIRRVNKSMIQVVEIEINLDLNCQRQCRK